MSIPELKISKQCALQWSDKFPAQIQRHLPDAGQSMIELPGPSLKLNRSGLKIQNGAGGILGRYILPNGKVQLWKTDAAPNLLGEFDAEICAQASIAANGKVFLAGQKGLFVLEGEGKLKQINSNNIYQLGTTKSNHSWTNGSDQQSFDLWNEAGDLVGNYPAKVGAELVLSAEGDVCFLGNDKPAGLRLLHENGEIESVSGFNLSPFDEILAYSKGHLQNNVAGGIQFQVANEDARELPLLNAGLDAEDRAFISGYDVGKVYLQKEGEAAMWLEIPVEMQNGPRPFYVIAIENEVIWVRGDAALLKFSKEGRIETRINLSNDNLEAETLGKAWSLTQILGLSGRSTMLSCVGPQGVALVRIDLN